MSKESKIHIPKDVLEELPDEDLLKVRDLFLQEWPKYLVAYTTIHSQCFNKTQDSSFPVVICAPNKDPQVGVVCIWYLNPGSIKMSVFCLSSDSEQLVEALMKTRRVDWKGNKVEILYNTHEGVVCTRKALEKLGLSWKENLGVIAYLPKEKSKQIFLETELDRDVKFETLHIQQAEELNNSWRHRSSISLEYFKVMLKRNAAKGVVDLHGIPRAWGMVSVRGDIHSVHTKDEWRRRGYGRLVVKNLVKSLADLDREIFAVVVQDNTASLKMFTGLGFELKYPAVWFEVGY